MRITSKKCTNHMEFIEEEYEVRVQIKRGKIITALVDVQDGEICSWKGKAKSDQRIIYRLPQDQKDKLDKLIEEMCIDE